MKLNAAEKLSPLCIKLVESIESKLAIHRSRLEADNTEIKTARIRGQIAELKEIHKDLTSDPHYKADQPYTDPYA